MKGTTQELFYDYFSNRFYKSTQLRISSGCGGQCLFCIRPDLEGREISFLTKQEIKTRLLQLWEDGFRHLEFLDHNFLSYGEEIEQVIQELLTKGVGFIFSCASSVQTLLRSQRALTPLKKLGLRQVRLRVINSNPEVLNRYGLTVTPADHHYAIQILQALRIQVNLGYILFEPLTTIDQLNNDLAFLIKNKLVGLAPYNEVLTTYLDLKTDSPIQCEYLGQSLIHSPTYPNLPYQLYAKDAEQVFHWLKFFEDTYDSRLEKIHNDLLDVRMKLSSEKPNWQVTNYGQSLLYVTLSLRMIPYDLFKALLTSAGDGSIQQIGEGEVRRQSEMRFKNIEDNLLAFRQSQNY